MKPWRVRRLTGSKKAMILRNNFCHTSETASRFCESCVETWRVTFLCFMPQFNEHYRRDNECELERQARTEVGRTRLNARYDAVKTVHASMKALLDEKKHFSSVNRGIKFNLEQQGFALSHALSTQRSQSLASFVSSKVRPSALLRYV